MTLTNKPFLVTVLAISISGCSTTCPRVNFVPPLGLKLLPDESLPDNAKRPIGEGGICSGNVYEVTSPVTVYRLWTQNKHSSGKNNSNLYGNWWALSVPEGPKEAYRKEFNICQSWNELTTLSYCTIKVGTKISVGPGQSASCPNGEMFSTSPALQVYIHNSDTTEGINKNTIQVENCSQPYKWPLVD